jgi:hypothetical protein
MEKRNTEASRAEHSVVPESGTAGPLGRKTFPPKAPQVPRLPPDFLSGSVASLNLVRLSFKKAAYVVVGWCSV